MTRALLLSAIALTACTQSAAPPAAPVTETQITRTASGGCTLTDVSPAAVEIVTQTELVEPEVLGPSGEILQAAIFRRVDRPVVRETRQVVLFDLVCPENQTPTLIQGLQRALMARGAYSGPIDGLLPSVTPALEQFQRARGQATQALTLATAQALGLTTVPRNPQPAQ